MTVFVLRKKGGYFAAKARVKTRNFEECLGLGRHLLRCRKAAPNASSPRACALRLPKMLLRTLYLFRFPGPLPHLKKSLLGAKASW
jgi:hypothetical protein